MPQQKLKGKIVSNKMQKTVVVEVARLTKHPLYGKYMKTSKRFKAHTDTAIPEGSTVFIESTKPLSKDKRWKVIKIL